MKIAPSICFAAGLIEAVHAQAARVAPTEPLPGSCTQHLSSKPLQLCRVFGASVLYLDLFHASVHKMCPMVIASSLDAILAYERLHRNALLPDSGANLSL